MKDYVECMRVIAVYNYVLFETDTGSSIRGPYEMQALSSYYVTKEVVDYDNQLSQIRQPPKVVHEVADKQ